MCVLHVCLYLYVYTATTNKPCWRVEKVSTEFHKKYFYKKEEMGFHRFIPGFYTHVYELFRGILKEDTEHSGLQETISYSIDS